MVSNVDIFLNRPRKILIFLGIWLSPENYIILRVIYKALIMITQYSFLLFEIMYVVFVWGDIDEVSEASYLIFTQASLCYKVTVFIVNKKNLIILLEYMKGKIFEPQTFLHNRILRNNAGKVNNLCAIFLISAITTCSLWAIMPLFDATETRFFPFKIWMPVDPQETPQYYFGYIYQVASIYISAMLFVSVDSTTLVMIMFGCAQLEIILDKIGQIQNVPLSSKPNIEEDKKKINDNNKLFDDCIRQHQAVIRFIELLENTYHANIFFQLSATVAIICIIGLRISIVEPSSVQFYSMLNYMVTMLSQLLLYCWCGSQITNKVIKSDIKKIPILLTTYDSLIFLFNLLLTMLFLILFHNTCGSLKNSEELREWLYQCPWYEQDAKFKRSLIIAMERMKRPTIFKAGHYIPLSRPTFIAVLRSSYSYFAVLNQANNK